MANSASKFFKRLGNKLKTELDPHRLGNPGNRKAWGRLGGRVANGVGIAQQVYKPVLDAIPGADIALDSVKNLAKGRVGKAISNGIEKGGHSLTSQNGMYHTQDIRPHFG